MVILFTWMYILSFSNVISQIDFLYICCLYDKDFAARFSKVVLINSRQQMAMLHKLMNHFYATPEKCIHGVKRRGKGFWVHNTWNINRTVWDFNNITHSLFHFWTLSRSSQQCSVNSNMLLLNCRLHGPKSYSSRHCD